MFAEKYHYTPKQIEELTDYQIKTLLSEVRDIGKTKKVSLDEAKMMAEKRKKETSELAESLEMRILDGSPERWKS